MSPPASSLCRPPLLLSKALPACLVRAINTRPFDDPPRTCPTALINHATSKLPKIVSDDAPDDVAERLLIMFLIFAVSLIGARTLYGTSAIQP